MNLAMFGTMLVVPFALDLVVKKWAQSALEYGQPVTVFPGFNLTLLFNPGVSFGLFPVGSPTGLAFMLLVQVVLCLGIAVYAWSQRGKLSCGQCCSCCPGLWPISWIGSSMVQ